MLTRKKQIHKQLKDGHSILQIIRAHFPHLVEKKGLNWTIEKVKKDWIGPELMEIYNSGEAFPKETA